MRAALLTLMLMFGSQAGAVDIYCAISKICNIDTEPKGCHLDMVDSGFSLAFNGVKVLWLENSACAPITITVGGRWKQDHNIVNQQKIILGCSNPKANVSSYLSINRLSGRFERRTVYPIGVSIESGTCIKGIQKF
jgi:hypothetical protein